MAPSGLWDSRPALARAGRSALVVGAVAGLLLLGQGALQYAGALPPPQVRTSVPPPALSGSARGIAHNAGNNPRTAERALRQGADVVEVDLIEARGELVAGRPQQPEWLADRLFLGPTLEQVWRRTPGRTAMLIDVKETRRDALDLLVRWLARRAGSREVLISTRDPGAVVYLDRRLPDVTLLYTVAYPNALRRLAQDGALRRAADGVSAYEKLLDPASMRWLSSEDLMVLAWPVNDAGRARELTALGIDGITTDSLDLLSALGGGS